MHTVAPPAAAGRRARRPVSGLAVALLASTLVLALSAPLTSAPAATGLVGLLGLSAVCLLGRVARCGAVAPAAGLGSAVPLLAAGLVADSAVVATMVVGAALAAVLLTVWRLRRRREWAPWDGTAGVAIPLVGALLLVGAGALSVAESGIGTDHLDSLELFVVTALPWAGLVACMGWLRRPVALALLLGPALQVGWLLQQ